MIFRVLFPNSDQDEELEERTQVLLRNNSEKVLDLLMAYAASAGKHKPFKPPLIVVFRDNPRPLLFTCLSSWLTEIPVAKIVESPLRRLAFQSRASDELFESAVEFIVSMFRETREANDSPDTLYEELGLLGPKLKNLEDPDTCRGLSRIYAEAGEMWTVLIAGAPEAYHFFVQSIAQCTEYHADLEVTKITFNFWYELAQLATAEKYRPAKELFTPIYERLVETMIRNLHYPDGNDRNDVFNGDREAEDKFRDFRHEMGGVLKDCCRVVGGSRCLGVAYAQVQRHTQDQAHGVRWQDIEAPLFSMGMMAQEIDTNENRVLPEVMKLLVNLPENDKIRYAATLVLGRCTEWTSKHPEYLQFQLNYISSGLENLNKEVVSAAAQALKHFCQDCKMVNSPEYMCLTIAASCQPGSRIGFILCENRFRSRP
jgi:transportin-3